MRTFGRWICLVTAGLAGLWLGTAVPLAVFLVTGLSPVVVYGVSLVAALVSAVAGSRFVPPFRTPALTLAIAAACGVALQAAFTASGGWSFGS